MVYKDFKDFFSQKYYDNIERIVKKYVIENKENINTSYIPNPYKHSLEEYSVMSIQFEKGTNSSDIKFYVAILAYVEITGKTSNYKNKDYDVDRAETWLSIEWSATLDNGLKNLKMLGYHDYSKKRYNEEKTLSKYLLPYVSTENLDKFAEKFLKKYYSEALEKPMPLPVFEIISKMGLNVLYGPMPDSIFGRTYFRDAQERVYNDSGVLIDTNIKKGTIIINRNVSFLKSIGDERNTIIHECLHWEYHKNFFELQHLLNPDFVSFSCEIIDKYIKTKSLSEEFEWMEWQANQITPRILMPSKMVLIKYQEIRNKVIENNPNIKNSKLCEIVLKEIANFFNVNEGAMKVRLFQLGIRDIMGVKNYIDKQSTESYYFNPSSLEENQTYKIDFLTALTIRFSNPHIEKYINERKIVYLDGFFIINSPKYVVKRNDGKNELSSYAREHIDECCLIINLKRKFNSSFDTKYYTLCYLCKDVCSSDSTIVELDINNRQNQRILGIAGSNEFATEEVKESLELIKKMNGTFSEAFEIWFQYEGFSSNRVCAEPAGLSETTVRNYRTSKEEPKLKNLLAIIAAHKVFPIISNALIERAGYNLRGKFSQINFFYYFLVEQCYGEGLEKWNERLNDFIKGETLP